MPVHVVIDLVRYVSTSKFPPGGGGGGLVSRKTLLEKEEKETLKN